MAHLSRRAQTLILQPTTLCNLNCSYCYLCPQSRRTREEMATQVAACTAAGITAQDTTKAVDIVWHGGEPLTTRRAHFHALVEVFEPLRRRGLIRHYVQTNATLIDDAWCELFTSYDFHVGVSIDGPEIANRNRADWSGAPVFSRVMRGVAALKSHGLDFSAICVVTPETITDPDALFDFFEHLGAASIGFNIEEFEGANDHRPAAGPQHIRRFWKRLFDRIAEGSPLRAREATRLLGYLADVRAGRRARWTDMAHDPIPTIGTNGDVVVLSPELYGVKDDAHHDFVIGNVTREPLPAIVARASQAPYVAQFLSGVDHCKAVCGIFTFCQGGQAGNRYFETGDFTTSETAYCRNTKQELVRALSETMGV
ncbi:uncharacterized protein CLV63_110171 [Murinocardiopsis flavida]|uniref:Radical SAM core domain-containing protein n=1 Tax=Murinocardiopsis flavida TaxID=645275 RepID=A0A2P8DI31_9ACTN|nr:cyclophane-forming radical SAM peptide maturase AmcB [Murinocardiopsis flavida]PSK96872.1 uncharacterized protein CLV63_110171 [Murinocardiopsis flavida]